MRGKFAATTLVKIKHKSLAEHQSKMRQVYFSVVPLCDDDDIHIPIKPPIQNPINTSSRWPQPMEK